MTCNETESELLQRAAKAWIQDVKLDYFQWRDERNRNAANRLALFAGYNAPTFNRAKAAVHGECPACREWREYNDRHFKRNKCTVRTYLECDCPKCQGLCTCLHR